METYAPASAVGLRFGFWPGLLLILILLAGRVELSGSGLAVPVRFRVGACSASEASEAPCAAARLGSSGLAEVDGKG